MGEISIAHFYYTKNRSHDNPGRIQCRLGVAKKYAKKRAEEVCVQKGSAKYKLIDSKERLASYVLNSEITCFTMKGKHLCKDHGYYIQKPIVTIDFICMESKFRA
mgnify:CR=1 FL=1